ncbi:MAG: phosphotransferase [Marmoricola sp.]
MTRGLPGRERWVGVPRSWPALTPEWMTAVLASDFTGAVVGRVEAGDPTRGTNDRAVVRLGYRTGRGPERVFVKREGRTTSRLALLALGAWDAEARLAAADVPLPLEHPAWYAAGVARHRLASVVVMEDVTLHEGRPNDPVRPLDVEQVRDGLRGLARLHAAYWQRPPVPALGFVRPWRLGPAWAPVSRASLARALRLLRSTGRGGLVGADAATLERGFRGWAGIAASGPPTLLHGDPHPGNTYALPGDRTGFYDWQLVRSGSWVHDVGYFLVASLAVADRRMVERDLLRDYLAELGPQAPDVAEAWALYRRSPAYGLATWLHTLTGGFQPRDACLATIERFAAAYADHVARAEG